MRSKQLLLTLSEELYDTLAQKRKEQGFMTMQELINDCIRKQIIIRPQQKTTVKNKGGRPKKVEFEDYFSTPTRETRRIERRMR